MSIDLTKVMDYLKGYFNPSPVNYNVSEPNYDEMGSQYAVYARLMKESCKTDMGGDTINLSNVNSTVNDKGEEVITFQDGTIHTTKKDGSIVVEKSDAPSKTGKRELDIPNLHSSKTLIRTHYKIQYNILVHMYSPTSLTLPELTLTQH